MMKIIREPIAALHVDGKWLMMNKSFEVGAKSDVSFLTVRKI